MKHVSILLLLLLNLFDLHADTDDNRDYYFSHINSDNGMSQNHVKAVIQDHWGFMWFGTQNGLNRYDGTTLKVFNCNDPRNGRENRNISTLFEDQSHNLWVGTDEGIFIFDPLSETFSFFDIVSDDNNLITDWIASIDSDKSDNIWIIAPNQGVFRYHQTSKKLYHYTLATNKDAIKGTPQSLCIDRSGKVWIGSNGTGVFCYNPREDKFMQYLGDSNGESLIEQNIFAMCECGNYLIIGVHEGNLYKFNKFSNEIVKVNATQVHKKIIRDVKCFDDDQIWVATQSGIYIINESRRSEYVVKEEPLHPYSLSDTFINTIYKDRNNTIWVGTKFGGVNYLPELSIEFEKYVPLGAGTQSLSSKRVRELVEDSQGNIWIGTEDAGLNRFNPRTKKIDVIKINGSGASALDNQNILGLMIDNGELWAGLFKDGLNKINIATSQSRHYTMEQLGLNEASVFALCKDTRDQIWIGNAWGIFMSKGDNLPMTRMYKFGFNFSYDIMQDKKGQIWVATMGNGIYCYDQSKDSIRHYINDPKDLTSLSSNSVSSITEDRSGVIWCSTDRGGICRYNAQSNSFTAFSVKDGLPDDVCYKIVEDDESNLWFGTEKGLVKFNPATKGVNVYTVNDGLLSNRFNYKSALKSRSGKLYFGGKDGMIAFNPYIINRNEDAPTVYITNLSIYNKSVEINAEGSPLTSSIIHTDHITLRSNQSYISFDFAALNYTAPLANRYAYKMENVDKDWVYTETTHSASYANMMPGEYTFKVIGANSDGVWSTQERALKITILPPWWATVYAFVIYLMACIALIYFALKGYQKRHEKKALEEQNLFKIQKEKELYSTKLDFFTDVAHEIRTPLTLISGPLESIMSTNITDEDTRENLTIIERNLKRLLDLFNQLLDLRKADSNKFILSLSTVDIAELLHESKHLFDATIEQTKRTMTIITPTEPIIAVVDKNAMMKIVSNLFSNAVKYSDAQITIELTKDESSFTIRVTNDGERIAPEFSQKIFEPFYQLGRDRNKTSSSGVGLSLALSLTELHQGSLCLDMIHSLNSFVLTIPLNIERSEQIDRDSKILQELVDDEQNTLAVKSDRAILLVEDNVEMRDFMKKKLQGLYDIHVASNGVEGLEVLENVSIDIIISDVIMPQMNGLEFCRHLKTNIEISHIPIILLTAKNDLASKIEGLEAGADAYIEKPCSFKYLAMQISTLLNNRHKEKVAYAQSQYTFAITPQMTKADEQFMMQVIDIIHSNITDPNFSVEHFAELLYMSRSSLHRKIKALSGLPPVDFVRLVRLRRAADIIKESNYRINEICYLVGINSPSYFSRLFQKQFGITPKKFAQQNQFSVTNED